jgi:hypothetical protein
MIRRTFLKAIACLPISLGLTKKPLAEGMLASTGWNNDDGLYSPSWHEQQVWKMACENETYVHWKYKEHGHLAFKFARICNSDTMYGDFIKVHHGEQLRKFIIGYFFSKHYPKYTLQQLELEVKHVTDYYVLEYQNNAVIVSCEKYSPEEIAKLEQIRAIFKKNNPTLDIDSPGFW